MQFTDLPEEVIIMIISELDVQSLESIYNTCQQFRNIICMHRVIRQCNMSMNMMATAYTFKLNFFKDISGHLQELNLCGLPDLTKSAVLPAMRRLKSLKKLDISYTSLSILDLLDIHQICPTLKDISINFVFGRPGLVRIGMNTLLKCQLLFEHFENVHFVGSLNNLIYSKLALYILNRAKLNILKYTIAERDNFCTTDVNIECNKLPQFKQFTIYLLNWKEYYKYHGCYDRLPVTSMIDLKTFEFIIIIMISLNGYLVNASPMFSSFFKENFGIDPDYTTDFRSLLEGNVVLMIWNKETTNFGGNFFYKLKNHLKMYFPYFYSSPCGTPAPKQFDWYHIVPRAPYVVKNENDYRYHPEAKKRRIAVQEFVLNCDTIFKEKSKLQLSVNFIAHVTSAITLTTNCDYLRKLTFLSLDGTVRYSSEFFNILFRSCDNLITLNVHAPTISPCAPSISRSIQLSHSLKNIRLVDKRIDFKTLYSSLSLCPTLENIHILDESEWEIRELADASIIIEKCNKLYSFYIEAHMSEIARLKKIRMLSKTTIRCNKNCVNFVVNAKSMISRYNYNPYVEVFNLSPIKAI